MSRAANTAAIARASGRPWAEWVETLAGSGARELTHAEIAALALDLMPPELERPAWWAQGVAIAYEQHIGRRVPGQSGAGDFRAGVSKTLRVDPDRALALWLDRLSGATEIAGVPAHNERLSRTDKRRVWRIDLADDGRVEADFTGEPGRTVLTVRHTGLPGPEELAEWKGHWAQVLAELATATRPAQPDAPAG